MATKYVKWTPKKKHDQFFLPRRRCKLTYGGWYGGRYIHAFDVYFRNANGIDQFEILYLLKGTKPPRGWQKSNMIVEKMRELDLPTEAVGVKVTYVPIKGAKVAKKTLDYPFRPKKEKR